MRSITEIGGFVIDGKYKLAEEIGRGGTAEVWRAEHILGRFPCAVKVMHMTRQDFELCQKEFSLLSQIYHPNIVRTFDMGFIDDTDQAYLSMEYIRGESWEALKTEQPSANAAVTWLSQIVSVLAYLHDPRVRVVHKDVKPGNIVVSGDRAVLIDFNISTAGRHDWGTPEYKCPLVVQQQQWSAYADVWALALSFYELITGTDVFDVETCFSVTLDHPPKVKVADRLLAGVTAIIGGGGQDTPPEGYRELFGLPDRASRGDTLPQALIDEFRVTSKNQQFLCLAMLSRDKPDGPVSKNVIVTEALRAANLPAGRVACEKLRAVFSQLKARGVVEYSGKRSAKARLTDDFIAAFHAQQG